MLLKFNGLPATIANAPHYHCHPTSRSVPAVLYSFFQLTSLYLPTNLSSVPADLSKGASRRFQAAGTQNPAPD